MSTEDKPYILVVDDEPAIRELIQDILQDEGYQVTTAEDGTAALAGERVPCTFGWHYMLRDNKLHCAYHMRSCDVMRHLHNDLFFANALCLLLIEQSGLDAKPGIMHFSASSLHCFQVDKYGLNIMVNE